MSHLSNSTGCQQTTTASRVQQSGSIFKRIHALLSYLTMHHSAKAKGIENHGKPILSLLDDVVSALPINPTGLILNVDKAAEYQTISEVWQSYDREPILVVLSDVKSSNNVEQVDPRGNATGSLLESVSASENQARELKVYSIKSHPHRLCLDLVFAPDSPTNSDPTPPAKASKATKKKCRSKAGERASANAKEKEAGLTVRRYEDGSYTTTTVSATGLGRHTRWHYDN